MASSLLIRGIDAAVIGYALIIGDQLCIRVSGKGIQGTAQLSDGENIISVPVRCDGDEHVLNWDTDKKLEWIRIEHEGETVALGGPAPEKMERNHTEKTGNSGISCKNDEISSVSIESEKQHQQRGGQRRWPPPPCWPSARYFYGEWSEEEV